MSLSLPTQNYCTRQAFSMPQFWTFSLHKIRGFASRSSTVRSALPFPPQTAYLKPKVLEHVFDRAMLTADPGA